MTAYFVRRLLLVPVTFLAITFMVYAVLRVVPGGPIEQAEAAMRMAAMQGEGGGGGGSLLGEADLQLPEEALKDLERFYHLDQPIPIGYLQWLGAWPRPQRTRVPASTLEKHPEAFGALKALQERVEATRRALGELLSPVEGLAYGGRIYRPATEEELAALSSEFRARAEHLVAQGFGKRDRLLELLQEQDMTYAAGRFYVPLEEAAHPDLVARARELLEALRLASRLKRQVLEKYGFEVVEGGTVYKVEKRFSGILQGDFGRSYTHGEPVGRLMAEKIWISARFTVPGYLLSWLVCVPLGILKALRHRSLFDALTSFAVFLGYAIPGFVLAMLLLAGVAAHVEWLPLGGYEPENLEGMGFWAATWEVLRYLFIPVAAYTATSFATMTILMKNSLIENLTADYVRTALAKGIPERRVVFVHALRNSLIPITAGIGSAVGILLAGSFLIEKTCNIPGIGLLGYEAIVQRDFPIVLGILVVGVLIRLFGNILSDLIWAAIDPRIRFQGGESA